MIFRLLIIIAAISLPKITIAQEPLLLGTFGSWRAIAAKESSGKIFCSLGAEDPQDGSNLVFGRYSNPEELILSIVFEDHNSFPDRPATIRIKIDDNEIINLEGTLLPGQFVYDLGLNETNNDLRSEFWRQIADGNYIRTISPKGDIVNEWSLEGIASAMIRSVECGRLQ